MVTYSLGDANSMEQVRGGLVLVLYLIGAAAQLHPG